MARQVDQAVRVAPLVVVPAKDLHEATASSMGWTIVISESNVHEAGVPTMSDETIGSSV